MGTDRAKLLFVIFDIRVPGCQKIQTTA